MGELLRIAVTYFAVLFPLVCLVAVGGVASRIRKDIRYGTLKWEEVNPVRFYLLAVPYYAFMVFMYTFIAGMLILTLYFWAVGTESSSWQSDATNYTELWGNMIGLVFAFVVGGLLESRIKQSTYNWVKKNDNP